MFCFQRFSVGEGNGTPLQYSCLENPMDGGPWWAAVHGVAQSRTRLKRLGSSSRPVVRNDPLPWQSSFIDVCEECVLAVFRTFQNVKLAAYLLMIRLKSALFKNALPLSRRHWCQPATVGCDAVLWSRAHPSSLGKKEHLFLFGISTHPVSGSLRLCEHPLLSTRITRDSVS